MRVVWKFPISVRGITTLPLPADHEVAPNRPLCVMAGRDPATGGPALWIELNPEAPKVERHFLIRATGEPIDEDETHVGSLIDGRFVWHVYERHGA